MEAARPLRLVDSGDRGTEVMAVPERTRAQIGSGHRREASLSGPLRKGREGTLWVWHPGQVCSGTGRGACEHGCVSPEASVADTEWGDTVRAEGERCEVGGQSCGSLEGIRESWEGFGEVFFFFFFN